MKGSLAFIYGGRGFEREVSLLGADFLLPITEKIGYGCIPVYITPDGRWTVKRRGDEFLRPDLYGDGETAGLINLGGRGGLCLGGETVVIDCAFPLLHGDFGEDGVVQGALENASIPYVGEGILGSAFCLDKAYCRAFADGLGIPGAKWLAPPISADGKAIAEMISERLRYPLFIKPRSLGSSIGVSTANTPDKLDQALKTASADFTRRVIIEELVDIDCELEIGVLRSKGKYLFTKIGKIENDSGFYSYEEKYSSRSEASVSSTADIPTSVKGAIEDYAKEIVASLGVKSLLRIDFFLDKRGNVYFNEINTMPGFTSSSLFWRMFSDMGISPESLLSALVEEAIA